jgi:hypothetical protein
LNIVWYASCSLLFHNLLSLGINFLPDGAHMVPSTEKKYPLEEIQKHLELDTTGSHPPIALPENSVEAGEPQFCTQEAQQRIAQMQENLAKQISQGLLSRLRGKMVPITTTITLIPQLLGRVDVTLSLCPAGNSLLVSTDILSTQELLHYAKDYLLQSLESKGLKIHRLVVNSSSLIETLPENHQVPLSHTKNERAERGERLPAASAVAVPEKDQLPIATRPLPTTIPDRFLTGNHTDLSSLPEEYYLIAQAAELSILA